MKTERSYLNRKPHAIIQASYVVSHFHLDVRCEHNVMMVITTPVFRDKPDLLDTVLMKITSCKFVMVKSLLMIVCIVDIMTPNIHFHK